MTKTFELEFIGENRKRLVCCVYCNYGIITFNICVLNHPF